MVDLHSPDFKLLEWLKESIPQYEIEAFEKKLVIKPNRITKSYQEIFSGYTTKDASEILTVTKTVENGTYKGLISGIGIDFMSFCSHHFLPFIGTVDIVYEPSISILGIGKLTRLVDYRTRRFNIQESIAKELCEDMMEFGRATGVFVRVTAHHTCVCYRGPKKFRSLNIVTYAMGTCANSDMTSIIQMHLNSDNIK